MIRGNIRLSILSIYPLVDETEHEEFSEIFRLIITSVPKLDASIGGYDINANVGIWKNMFAQSFGTFGNKKDRKASRDIFK